MQNNYLNLSGLKKIYSGLLLTSLLATGANAQTQIFHEDFGTPVGRTTTPYAATGTNAFVFADPGLTYPAGYPDGPDAAKLLENNHYAVLAAQNIYTSVGGDPAGYQIWENLKLANDATGNSAGGIMVVNAGTTPGVLYKRRTLLERGKYYKLTYYLWVEHPTVQLKTNMHDASGSLGLGTNLGTSQNSSAYTWQLQTQYFYLPVSACDDNNYTISLQNHALNNSGNDFAIDEITLVEVPSSEGSGSAAIILAPCVDGLDVPVAANDESLGNTPGATVTLEVLANDALITGVNTVNFGFLVPQGASAGIWDNSITVPGEGKWTYGTFWVGGTQITGVQFVPQSGFTGNPTPVQYTISQSYAYSGTDTNVPAGANPIDVVSAPATITVTYQGSIPTPNNDSETVANLNNPVVLDILSNDKLGDGSTTPTFSDVTVTLRNPNTGVVGEGPVTVYGEGVWNYNSTTGQLTFTADSGFSGTPTPITYTITEGGVKSAPATASIIVNPSLPVKLVRFDAFAEGTLAQLSWETSEETNSSNFDVERSENAKSWEKVGTVAALGESSKNQKYTFAAPVLTGKTTYYRLKMVDLDGTFAYSTIKSVNGKEGQKSVAYVFPNPASDKLVISAENASGVKSVWIYNTNGKLALNTGNVVNNEVNIKTLPAGKYLVRIVYLDKTTKVSQILVTR